MELNNENMKKIRHLIVFTALIILCFWKYEMVIQAVKFVISVLFPFILVVRLHLCLMYRCILLRIADSGKVEREI